MNTHLAEAGEAYEEFDRSPRGRRQMREFMKLKPGDRVGPEDERFGMPPKVERPYDRYRQVIGRLLLRAKATGCKRQPLKSQLIKRFDEMDTDNLMVMMEAFAIIQPDRK